MTSPNSAISLTTPIPSALGLLALAAGGSACQARIANCRREIGAASIEHFARTYLSRHASLPFSRMHKEVFALLETATAQRSARLAIAAPRGHAKSTLVTLTYALWSMLFGHDPYIVIISETADQAVQRLAEIRTELESNTRLRQDFPKACIIPPAAIRAVRWRKGELITGSGARLTALGVDSKIRGRKHGEHRPSLIILDDAESDTGARSPEQRDRLKDWFTRAVLKAGSPETNIIAVGTIIHYDSLLAHLVDPKRTPGWTGRVYKAVEQFSRRPELWKTWEDIYSGRQEHQGAHGPEAAKAFYELNTEQMLEGTSVLWPERESYFELMGMRLREGRGSFDAEKQNDPSGDRDALFNRDELLYWDDTFPNEAQLLASLSPESRMFGACDPSLGRFGGSGIGTRGDDTAIITVVKDAVTGIIYVLDADICKRKPAETIDALLSYQRLRNYRYLAIETNQFQQFLADEVIRRAREVQLTVPVWSVNHTTDKLGRIQKLQPLLSTGRVRLSRRHTRLLQQLEQFPLAAHDDGPDALEMAVDTAALSFDLGRGQFVY